MQAVSTSNIIFLNMLARATEAANASDTPCEPASENTMDVMAAVFEAIRPSPCDSRLDIWNDGNDGTLSLHTSIFGSEVEIDIGNEGEMVLLISGKGESKVWGFNAKRESVAELAEIVAANT